MPLEVKKERGMTIAMRWLRDFARHRKGKSMVDRLSGEIIDAYKGEGSAVKSWIAAGGIARFTI